MIKEILSLSEERYKEEYKEIKHFDELIDYLNVKNKTSILQELAQNKSLCYLFVNYYKSKQRF